MGHHQGLDEVYCRGKCQDVGQTQSDGQIRVEVKMRDMVRFRVRVRVSIKVQFRVRVRLSIRFEVKVRITFR